MRTPLVAALLTVALALPLAPAAADPGAPGEPGVPAEGVEGAEPTPPVADTPREEAEAALAEAEELFEASPAEAEDLIAEGGADATMVLNELMRSRANLSRADRKRANALLARPTDGAADRFGDGYTGTEEAPLCGAHVCIHYVSEAEGGTDAPADAGAPGSPAPPSVQETLDVAEHVHETFTGAGYLAPDPDRGRGGSNLVDIYLADIGAEGLYGYCTSDQRRSRKPWNRWAYCVIDNDFDSAQFPRKTPEQNRAVTLAHEYFHAVQFAYDAYEDLWFMEATAAWVEDEVYDDIDDNRQFLRGGQLRRPGTALDDTSISAYGQWIFFRYLGERWRASQGGLPVIVRDAWQRASGRSGAPDMFSTQAVHHVLKARRAKFTKVYGEFAAANRDPAQFYEEGAAYPRPGARRVRLGSRDRTAQASRRLDHLTSQTTRFLPGSGLRHRRWKIRVRVDMPPRRTAPVAHLVIHQRNGRSVTRAVRLSRSGAGRATAPFSSRRVRSVELVLANASRRMVCWRGTFLACQGAPRDDRALTTFQARLSRR